MRLHSWLNLLASSHRSGRPAGTGRRSRGRGAPVGIERLEERRLLTTFAATTYLDSLDADPGDGSALDEQGRISLRSAIQEANALPGAATVLLSPGIYFLSQGEPHSEFDENQAAAGDLDITDDLTIVGDSVHTTVIDAQFLDRLFHVHPGATLTLRNVRLTNGGLGDRGDGGAVLVEGGGLVLEGVTVQFSDAVNGGAIASFGGSVTLRDSTLSSITRERSPRIRRADSAADCSCPAGRF